MSKKGLVALLTNHDDDVYCFRKELVEGLINDGYEVLISCPYGEKLEMMKHVKYIYDDVVIDRRGMNIFKDLKLYRHYKKLFEKHRPCAVLTYTAKPNVYGAAAARALKIPYICNVTGWGSTLEKNSIVKTGILLLYSHSLRHAYHVFFQNRENMHFAEKKRMVKASYSLIPGSGVSLERFKPLPYPNDDKVVFNYIGRVMKEKGINDYIEAAKRIKEKYPDTEFNVLGFIEPSESKYADILDELGKKGTVNYLGQQKYVQPFIEKAHALVHPSEHEGMSNVLLENAACARPLVTTNIFGCAEAVENNVTGYLYEKGNVDELVMKIEKFLSLDNSIRAKMGQAGREKMEKEFSRDIVVKKYLTVLNTVAERE